MVGRLPDKMQFRTDYFSAEHYLQLLENFSDLRMTEALQLSMAFMHGYNRLYNLPLSSFFTAEQRFNYIRQAHLSVIFSALKSFYSFLQYVKGHILSVATVYDLFGDVTLLTKRSLQSIDHLYYVVAARLSDRYAHVTKNKK